MQLIVSGIGVTCPKQRTPKYGYGQIFHCKPNGFMLGSYALLMEHFGAQSSFDRFDGRG